MLVNNNQNPNPSPKEEEEEEVAPVSVDDIEEQNTLRDERIASDPVVKFITAVIKKTKSLSGQGDEKNAESQQFAPPPKEEKPIKTEQDEINELVEIAMTQGVERACNIARNKTAYIVDAFHDKLIEELKNRKTE